MKPVFALLTLLFVSVAEAQSPTPKLFAEDKLLDLTLSYDMIKLQTEKETLRQQGLDGEVTVEWKSIPVKVMPRGMGSFSCIQPQLKIDFSNPASAETPFEGLKKIKLYTKGLCLETKTDPEQDRKILSNYLTYRLYELMNPLSYKTRLVRVSYRDKSGTIAPYTQLAFFLEPSTLFESRTQMKEVEQDELFQLGPKITPLVDGQSLKLVNAFELFIANFDYGVPGFFSHILNQVSPQQVTYFKKNVDMYRDSSGKLYPIAYDFDLSRFAYFGPFCFFGYRFFSSQNGPSNCEPSNIATGIQTDLEVFKFKSDAAEQAEHFKKAVIKWQELYGTEIKKLGPEYETGLKSYIEAFDLAIGL